MLDTGKQRKIVSTIIRRRKQRKYVAESSFVGDVASMSVELAQQSSIVPDGFLVAPEIFYRAVLNSLAESVLITDAQRRIRYANRFVTEMTGFAPEEILGRTICDVFLSGNNKIDCDSRDPLAEQPSTCDVEVKRKDEKLHWVRIKTTPYRNEQGEIVGTVAAMSCIERQKSLEQENEVLQEEVRLSFGSIVGESPVLRKIMAQIATVAPTEASVLILGESGTGKELVARAIHDLSGRKERALVRVNCASIPKDLFESEFFGHARGAFTGAVRDRAGRFELANTGTLFLDEIAEIPPDLQSKLLRVLQEGQFERLGEDRTRSVDVRLIAATNRDLLAEAKAGRFRLDLYYRLCVFPVELPPLRERLDDVGLLAEHFIGQSSRRLGIVAPRLTRVNMQELQSYDWPGNIRELQNVVERAVILARGGSLRFDLPPHEPQNRLVGSPPPLAEQEHEVSLDELVVREREIVTEALRRGKGKIYGVGGAAERLKVRPTTLVSMLKRLGISRREVM